jgi:hypothetical protein
MCLDIVKCPPESKIIPGISKWIIIFKKFALTSNQINTYQNNEKHGFICLTTFNQNGHGLK